MAPTRLLSRTPSLFAVLAAPPADPVSGELNTTGILTFIASKIAPIVIMAIAVVIISRAGKGEVSKVLTSTAIVIVGVVLLAGGGALMLFGGAIVKLMFNS